MEQRLNCKIVLLGNSGVGKTSLVMRWTTGNFQQSIKTTIGSNHQRKTVTIDKYDVDLYLWDTAGQEQYRALTPLYTRSASAAIITASIDDEGSFEALQTWIDLLSSSCQRTPPMILAVNKIDLMNQPEAVQLSTEEIEARYLPLFSSIFFVSAATGEGVDTVFMQAAQSAYHYIREDPQQQIKPLMENENSGKKECC
ncbi:small GTP-binding protein [Tritrichomonas foetus]|uniref:Small GTP-binding protein n=1 Tax=Tritrichomonas foetus TaxID=1144522 RepID=A0A1J4KR20_9EUKA|nr:small GTP-binding protein [Tritrichomonas foetus]|eukprot:OHT11917.1 small GTP-binding protein [Tritrichomonas foetus]